MTTAAARLDLRLNPADKARISRAADLRGVPLSAFVRNAVDARGGECHGGGVDRDLVGGGVQALSESARCALPAHCQVEEGARPRCTELTSAIGRAAAAQAT